MSWSQRPEVNVGVAAALLFCALSTPLLADDLSVCPQLPGDALQRFDIFDGPPEDRAFLMMEKSAADTMTLPVGHIFDQGRIVSVRCYYRGGGTQIVQIRQRVERCNSSRTSDGVALLVCN